MDATVSNEKPAGLKHLLKNPNFRFLWLGQIISDFGDSLTMLALLIFVNQVTGSAAAIATMMIVLAVPQVTVGLVAGVYVDRLDRRLIMIVSDVMRGALVLGFVGVVLLGSANNLWLLYVIAFLQATIGTLFNPARGALLPNIVPTSALLPANSISQTSKVIFGLLGTAMAGILIGVSKEVWLPFVIDSLTFFASALLIWRIKAPRHVPDLTAKGDIGAIFGQLGAGLKLIGGSRMLTGMLIAMAVTMLGMGAVNVLLVPLIINDLQLPPTLFGVIEFAQTAGMVISGALLVAFATRVKPGTIIGTTLSALGIGIAAIALAHSILEIGVILFVAGLVIVPLQASVTTIMQTNVDNKMRGRVGAALNSIISVASLLSMGLAGILAQEVGVRNVFLLSGGLVLLAGISSAFILKERKNTALATRDPELVTIQGH